VFAGTVVGTETVNTAEDCIPPEIVTVFPDRKLATGPPETTGVTVEFKLTVPANAPRLVAYMEKEKVAGSVTLIADIAELSVKSLTA
jgi:hypothetical protein